jgi:hypothetical protein
MIGLKITITDITSRTIRDHALTKSTMCSRDGRSNSVQFLVRRFFSMCAGCVVVCSRPPISCVPHASRLHCLVYLLSWSPVLPAQATSTNTGRCWAHTGNNLPISEKRGATPCARHEQHGVVMALCRVPCNEGLPPIDDQHSHSSELLDPPLRLVEPSSA